MIVHCKRIFSAKQFLWELPWHELVTNFFNLLEKTMSSHNITFKFKDHL